MLRLSKELDVAHSGLNNFPALALHEGQRRSATVFAKPISCVYTYQWSGLLPLS